MNSDKVETQLFEISKKLDTLIRLLALGLIGDMKTQKKQITLLSDAGFRPKEIAVILSTTSNTVSVALHSIKKERSEKKAREGSGPEERVQHTEARNQSEAADNAERVQDPIES